jgi:hypothetical protein
VQPVQLDVVADVDDRGDLLRRPHPDQAGEQAGGSDAARQHRDQRELLS